jgi:hypothetical protein
MTASPLAASRTTATAAATMKLVPNQYRDQADRDHTQPVVPG